MKRNIIVLLVVLTLASCKKEKITCYECKGIISQSVYQDIGCLTQEQWDKFMLADGNGVAIDKNSNCRKR
jgi:hypothetical protein